MSATENAKEVSLPSLDFEHQALINTVPNEYKERVSPQGSFSDFSQNTAPISEVKNSLEASNASLNDKMQFQGASNSAPLTATDDSKTLQNIKYQHLILQSPRRGKIIFQLIPKFHFQI